MLLSDCGLSEFSKRVAKYQCQLVLWKVFLIIFLLFIYFGRNPFIDSQHNTVIQIYLCFWAMILFLWLSDCERILYRSGLGSQNIMIPQMVSSYELPKNLVEMQILGPLPLRFITITSGAGSRSLFLISIPNDSHVASLRTSVLVKHK